MSGKPTWTPLTYPDMRLSAAEMNALAHAVVRLCGGSFARAIADGAGVHVRPGRRITPRDDGFWARITGSTADGDNRWTYSWEEVAKTGAGYGGWGALDDGRTGADNAYNSIEDMNAATGVQGNGVDVAHLDTDDYTFALQPCPTDAVVWMREVKVDGDAEYWFAYENGVDGGCD